MEDPVWAGGQGMPSILSPLKIRDRNGSYLLYTLSLFSLPLLNFSASGTFGGVWEYDVQYVVSK